MTTLTIEDHIAAAKTALGQRRLNHALDSIVSALETLAPKAATTPTPVKAKEVLLEAPEEIVAPKVPETSNDAVAAPEEVVEATEEATTEGATTKKKKVAGTRANDVAATPGSIAV